MAQVVPGALAPVDIAVANILIGQLVRPSMVVALCTSIKPGGLLCFSGIRPSEVRMTARLKSLYFSIHLMCSLQIANLEAAYGDWLDWESEFYAEAVPGPEGREYWGTWARLVGRRKVAGDGAASVAMLEALSELAVS